MKTKLFICIGAQKAGTSWLYRCLQEHKQISCIPCKEPHFFSTHYSPDKVGEYLKSFKCSSRILFEASTSYLSSEETPSRIIKHFPDVKIVVLLRDPIDRTMSHYRHLKNTGVISNETSLLESIDLHPSLIENSLYSKHLSNYLHYIKKENILFLNFDDIKNNPQELLNKVCFFIKVRPFTPSIIGFKYHSSEARSNPYYIRIAKLYRKLSKNKYGVFLISTLRKIGVNNILIEKFLRIGRKKTLVKKEEAKLIRDLTQHDTRKLSQLSGINHN